MIDRTLFHLDCDNIIDDRFSYTPFSERRHSLRAMGVYAFALSYTENTRDGFRN